MLIGLLISLRFGVALEVDPCLGRSSAGAFEGACRVGIAGVVVTVGAPEEVPVVAGEPALPPAN